MKPRPWTLAQLAKGVHLSIGEVHYSIHRLTEVRLLSVVDRQVNRHALEEFLIHGARYVFPPTYGGLTRGIVTSFGAPVLSKLFVISGDVPVWPYCTGTVRGLIFSPLYPAAPDAALDDADFYELLAITDALRGDSRGRERTAAEKLLREHLNGGAPTI